MMERMQRISVRRGKSEYGALMRRFRLTILPALVLLLATLLLPGCGKEEIPEGSSAIYYLSSDETHLETHYRQMTNVDPEARLAQLLSYLGEMPERLEYKAPLSMGFTLNSYSLDDGWVTLDFSVEYKYLTPAQEVLVRAAIVRTLVQEPGIGKVLFQVEGEPLQDALGGPVGWMDSGTFISNDGNEINTYEEVKVSLYFANEEGTGLIMAYREKFYPTSMPLERFVVEEMIKGPSGQIPGLYPTVNPETTIIGVSTRDGVCYVNLDEKFLTTIGNCSTEISVYSIVNSLTDLDSVDKVQILIGGEVPQTFTTTTFERNDALVTTLQQ
ncbi:MAG: GerMN domain-containing protein [Lachnospiraceae bacterium]|nr:GerMN domain-containing protein [Lachnospiraceae bacterium]